MTERRKRLRTSAVLVILAALALGLEAPRTTESRQPRKATAAEPAKASTGRATAEGKSPAGPKTMNVGVPFFIWCARREASGLD